MAVHLMPAPGAHQLSLQCWCRPHLVTAVIAGKKRAAIRHRKARQVLATTVQPRGE